MVREVTTFASPPPTQEKNLAPTSRKKTDPYVPPKDSIDISPAITTSKLFQERSKNQNLLKRNFKKYVSTPLYYIIFLPLKIILSPMRLVLNIFWKFFFQKPENSLAKYQRTQEEQKNPRERVKKELNEKLGIEKK